jgi:hypothetical protein
MSGNPGENRFPAAKVELRNPGVKPGFAADAELRKLGLAEENQESPVETRFCSATATSEVALAGENSGLGTETRFVVQRPTSGCKSPGQSVRERGKRA